MRRISQVLVVAGLIALSASRADAAMVSPSTLSFPDTTVGQTSATQTIHATMQTGEFSYVVLSDPTNFTITADNCLPVNNLPCDVTIAFNPTSVGLHSATVDIGQTNPGGYCKPPGLPGPPCFVPPTTKATVPLSGTGLTEDSLPEAPIIVLLPVPAVVIGGGWWSLRRKRRPTALG